VVIRLVIETDERVGFEPSIAEGVEPLIKNLKSGCSMTLDELYEVICDRRDHPTPGSYTARLMAEGEDEMVKKVGEEAIEVILAAKAQGDGRLVEEVADLTYHVLVLMAARGLTPNDVRAELDRRHR
jgi:phosphoribosyl-ATP pyrophosphohydrolase